LTHFLWINFLSIYIGRKIYKNLNDFKDVSQKDWDIIKRKVKIKIKYKNLEFDAYNYKRGSLILMLFNQKKTILDDLIVSRIKEGGKNRIIKKIITYSLKKYFSQLKNDVK
jgi:hypothetical protein